MRRRLLVAVALLVPLGILTKLYAGPAQAWVRGHAGGPLYVMFWCFLVLVLRPQLSPWIAGAGVLAVTTGLELLQLWHPPWLEAIRSSFLGHALIGSTFSGWDLPHYLAGMLLAVWIARAAQRGAQPSASSR